MVQRRWLNFGADGDATRVKEMHTRMFAPSILSGGEISVGGTDYVNIAPWSAIGENGIIISVDSVTAISIPTGSAPQNYTIVLIHEDQNIVGGTSATMSLQTGIKFTVANGVIFGWIVYPGGGAAISAEMIYSVRSKTQVIKSSERQQYYAPYVDLGSGVSLSPGLHVYSSSASVVWTTGVHPTLGRFYTKFANGTGSAQTITFEAQFLVADPVPRVFEVLCSKEASPAVLSSVAVYGSDGAAVTDTDSETIDNATDGTRTFRVRALTVTTFEIGKFVRVKFVVSVSDATNLYAFEIRATSLEEPAI